MMTAIKSIHSKEIAKSYRVVYTYSITEQQELHSHKKTINSEVIVDSNNVHYAFIDLIEKHKFEQLSSLSIDTIEEITQNL